jgi:hypothetical protein
MNCLKTDVKFYRYNETVRGSLNYSDSEIRSTSVRDHQA